MLCPCYMFSSQPVTFEHGLVSQSNLTVELISLVAFFLYIDLQTESGLIISQLLSCSTSVVFLSVGLSYRLQCINII